MIGRISGAAAAAFWALLAVRWFDPAAGWRPAWLADLPPATLALPALGLGLVWLRARRAALLGLPLGSGRRGLLLSMALALLFRLPLAWQGAAGYTTADGALSGIVALHARQGTAHYVFVPGVPYSGSLKSHLAAGLGTLLDLPRAFTLCSILFYVLFVAGLYRLAQLAETPGRSFAVAAGLYAAFAPAFVTRYSLSNDGNYVEVLALGSWALWLAARWISEPDRRALLSLPLGLLLGVALWCHILAILHVAAVGLCLAWVDARQTLRRLPALAGGAALGYLPGLLWNAAHGWESLRYLVPGFSSVGQIDTGPGLAGRAAAMLGEQWPLLMGYDLGYVGAPDVAMKGLAWLAVVAALVAAASALGALRDNAALRVLLVFAAVNLLIAIAALPHVPGNPRYILFLMTPLPVFLARSFGHGWSRILLGLLVVLGAAGSLAQWPQAARADARWRGFARDLGRAGVRFCYSDFYQATRINFLSEERIVCSSELGPSSAEYFREYRARVAAASEAALIPVNATAGDKIARRLERLGVSYERRDLAKPVFLRLSRKVVPEELHGASAAGSPLWPKAEASLSQTAGTLKLAGLDAPVEVLRDRWGIPHIYAQSVEDLFFAQGFVQAQDRLFQMELWRRTTQGRLSELLGPTFVERDRLTRLVSRFRGDMNEEWRSYDPEARRIVLSFVRGVNAYVASRDGRPPLEFELAGMRLEAWAPEDLLARAEAFGMSGNADSEVAFARLVHEIGLPAALALRPPDPSVAVEAPAGVDLGAVDAALGRSLSLIGSSARFGPAEGSNNWVVAGSRTASGRPLLADDPHRALDHPSLRYLVHLVGPGFNVIGAVVPWFPGVAIGHNERVGWGLTIFAIDAQDLVVEQTHPQERDLYRVGNRWARMSVTSETVQVKGAAPARVELRYTRNGPVVHEDRARRLAYALRWTGSEPGTAGYLAGLALDRAKSAAEFREALRRWRMPGENFVFADVDGSIGYQATGLAPRRRLGAGLLPGPAAKEYAWGGWLPMEELPHAENPASGVLATANDNTLPPGYPHAVGYEWADAARIRRVREVLAQDRRFTVADFEALQHDVVALPARDLVPLLRRVQVRSAAARSARERLLRWDFRMQQASVGAAVFAAWQAHLSRGLVQRQRTRSGKEFETSLLEWPSPSVLVAHLTPATSETDALLVEAIESAVADLSRRLGPEAEDWQWGRLHAAAFRHPLSLDEATRTLFDRGPYQRPGYGYTVDSTSGANYRQAAGASFREILDFSDWDRSVATSAPGQSGQPASPHFDDLARLWSEGRYFPLAFSRKKVEEVTESRLVLEP